MNKDFSGLRRVTTTFQLIVVLLCPFSLRSHAAILKIPNELFYENELQVFADQWDREAYCNWEYLPKKVKL